MTTMYLIKTARGVHGMSEDDHKAWVKFKNWLAKLEPGESFQLEYKRPRNIKNHRRLFAMLKIVSEYSDIYDNTDKALLAVKIAAGHCDFIPNPITGELQALPRSISFDIMDEESKFETFFSNAIQGILTHILPTMDEDSLNHALELIIGF